ncbi:hypothetical protein B1A99_01570 [Cohnella sp. CIP 111063]|jgi:uncharacterized protein YrzB (UPF0473 family)|uniref:DUF1292 domain-containing protein n=1 Tax=unclassified Cohnella TaxID=2636738 RepID=UPI000B8BD944|nr:MULTISPECIES: DUF1292 domain-containing protein [unclassified Cohnella]OXS62577.1 hypothetical protein B1A99_01570 [Cohnella sp. CIP 111063]PRX74827.1 uncharacterized protein YrzB (UPF0473 family) [Cohnella sp. SGD-V74]
MTDFNHNEEEAELIYITDDEGNDEPFEVVMRFELDDGTDRKYMMVVPAEENGDEEQEVFAFRYDEDNEGEIKLYPIEDPAEWDMVEETFNTLIGEFGEADA